MLSVLKVSQEGVLEKKSIAKCLKVGMLEAIKKLYSLDVFRKCISKCIVSVSVLVSVLKVCQKCVEEFKEKSVKKGRQKVEKGK